MTPHKYTSYEVTPPTKQQYASHHEHIIFILLSIIKILNREENERI